jgi:hypothetical protein
MGSAGSGTARLPDDAGELVEIVQEIERREIVAAAGIILAPLAAAEHHAGVASGRRLAGLQIEMGDVEDLPHRG